MLYTDVRNIPSLNLISLDISNLSGIEYFKALTTLNCIDSKLTTLDVYRKSLQFIISTILK